MKTFKFNLKVSFDESWIKDGWDAEIIKQKLQEFIQESMNPYPHSRKGFVADIQFDGIVDGSEGEKFARQCSFTGEGMNEGWCFGDGQTYAKYESDADKQAKDWGYDNLQDAYNDDMVYWTEWEDESDYQYIMKDGKLTEI